MSGGARRDRNQTRRLRNRQKWCASHESSDIIHPATGVKIAYPSMIFGHAIYLFPAKGGPAPDRVPTRFLAPPLPQRKRSKCLAYDLPGFAPPQAIRRQSGTRPPEIGAGAIAETAAEPSVPQRPQGRFLLRTQRHRRCELQLSRAYGPQSVNTGPDSGRPVRATIAWRASESARRTCSPLPAESSRGVRTADMRAPQIEPLHVIPERLVRSAPPPHWVRCRFGRARAVVHLPGNTATPCQSCPAPHSINASHCRR